jgi:hypothetical protein
MFHFHIDEVGHPELRRVVGDFRIVTETRMHTSGIVPRWPFSTPLVVGRESYNQIRSSNRTISIVRTSIGWSTVLSDEGGKATGDEGMRGYCSSQSGRPRDPKENAKQHTVDSGGGGDESIWPFICH